MAYHGMAISMLLEDMTRERERERLRISPMEATGMDPNQRQALEAGGSAKFEELFDLK